MYSTLVYNITRTTYRVYRYNQGSTIGHMWIPYAKIIRKYTVTIFRLLLHFRESYVQKFFAYECTCPAFDFTDRALMVCVESAYSYVYDHVRYDYVAMPCLISMISDPLHCILFYGIVLNNLRTLSR